MLHPDFNVFPKTTHPTLTSLTPLYAQQTAQTRGKILEDLSRDPTTSDREGFVYGFVIPEDKNLRTNFKMKLGRTAREDPRKRIREWNGQEIFTMKSSYNIRFERLIHMFFDEQNFHRPSKTKPGSHEVEWFHFQGMRQTDVVRRIMDIHDLVEDIFNDTDEFIKSTEVHPQGAKKNPVVGATQVQKINLNTATPSQLQKIRGIGPVKSNAIVDYRKTHGIYKTVSDLTKVRGIGPGILSKVHHNVCV